MNRRNTGLVDSNSELFKILDSNIMEEIRNSDHLREFYKKLIKTDAQIQKLKNSNDLSMISVDNIEDKYKTFSDRAKRSLKNLHKPLQLFHLKKNKKENVKVNDKTIDERETDIGNTKTKEDRKESEVTKDSKLKKINGTRNKRFDNISKPDGFVIENKKVLIQYKPRYINRKSKCSHAPKESKSHENQLKHPFYQNTQRLDELLDKFIDNNFPEIVANEFGLNVLLGKMKNKCKHPKIEVETPIAKEKPILGLTFAKKPVTNIKDELSNIKDNTHENGFKKVNDDFTMISETGEEKREDTSTNVYGQPIVLSTMYDGYNNYKRTTYLSHPLVDRVPNARKLLQTDADDDIKEVLVGSDSHDDVKENRKKRNDEPTLEDMNIKLKLNPPSILNPNWKGPMPLYPDELKSMVKQEPDGNSNPVHIKYNSETNEDSVINKVEIPDRSKDALETDENFVNQIETSVLSKDSPSETDEFETDLTDMEYIEDYFRNKYDRLVQMAQAYSDYGVLESKKASAEKKLDAKVKLDGPDHRVKLSISGFKKRFKNNLFRRPKKGSQDKSTAEGFRFEFHPTVTSREDDPREIYKAIQKHIKVSNCKPKQSSLHQVLPTLDMPLMYSPRMEELKTTKKFTITNDNNLVFSVGRARRSLKSIEFTNDETFEMVSNKNQEAIDTKLSKNVSDNKKREVDINYILSENNNTTSAMKVTTDESVRNITDIFDANDENNTVKLDKREGNITDMNLSDFFMLLANWFHSLDGGDVGLNHSIIGNSSSPKKSKPTELAKVTVDISYPIYDSDMFDNIGHRSRVLLAVEDINDVNATVGVEHQADQLKTKGFSAITDPINTNITKLTPKTTSVENKIKSIVKRNVDDSNLIFWNDLYDDEYGVSVDNFENNIRDKHSVGSNFMKKPNMWFHDKVKKFADKIHRKADSLRKEHKDSDTVKNKKNDKDTVKIKSKPKDAVNKRISRRAEGNLGQVTKTDFAALTANMKKICRQAAKDVVLANKVEAREVSKEGQVASTLMQQLVRLMGDLVDYQVKQRTCRRLPPDLQNFLEWLTSSNSETDRYSPGYNDEYPVDYSKMNDKTEEDHTLGTSSSEREDGPDARSDCLGTLQAVEALMRQYDDMADDEKSKITGVKEYLENQKQYLQKQMTSSHDYSLYNMDLLRYRRDITEPQKTEKSENTTKNLKHNKRRQRFKQAVKNFMKKYARKHRNSKPSDKNNANNTKKANNKIKALINESKNKVEEHSEGDSETVKEKRNLRDIYYKAIADAKKMTTVKNHGK